MEAASAGHVPVAKILLEHGAGINTHSNEFKESALTLACYKGHLEMVRFLLEAGADQVTMIVSSFSLRCTVKIILDEIKCALICVSTDDKIIVGRENTCHIPPNIQIGKLLPLLFSGKSVSEKEEMQLF